MWGAGGKRAGGGKKGETEVEIVRGDAEAWGTGRERQFVYIVGTL